MIVHSPKTEHYAGKDCRVVPIFPELRPYLEAAYNQAPEGTEHVITRSCDANSNLRTQFQRIIKRAGLTPWPKLFQNLRSTRETELTEQFPIHVVCKWIGNSEAIAAKHYLQVTDQHFERALHNPVQSAHVSPRNASQTQPVAHEKTPVLQGSASGCDYLPVSQVEDTGLEQCANSPGKTALSKLGAAESGAVVARNNAVDPELARVIELWPALTESAKADILEVVAKDRGPK